MIFESSSGSIPSQPLILLVISFVGINSIRAIALSCRRMARAFGGIFMLHLGIKTKNYIRFTKFQRYFNPKESTRLITRFQTATVFITANADDSIF